MAREIVAWCDRHLHLQQEHIPAEETRVGIDSQWWSADLCTGCAGDLIDPVAHLLAAHGRPLKVEGLGGNLPTLIAPRTTKVILGLPSPDIEPDEDENHRFRVNLDARRGGSRKGKLPKPESANRQLPCLFCGIYLQDGGNAPHMRLHGFSVLTRAVGTLCPWCGDSFDGLGSHMVRAHEDEVDMPFQIVREILNAHLRKARFDQLHAIRDRAYNTQPLGPILQEWTRA